MLICSARRRQTTSKEPDRLRLFPVAWARVEPEPGGAVGRLRNQPLPPWLFNWRLSGLRGGIDAALEAGKLLGTAGKGLAQEAFRFRLPDFQFLHFALPELGFGLTEAAEEPLAIDEGIDQEALLGGGGLPALRIRR